MVMRTYDEELDSTGQLVLRCWTSATINSAAILVTKRPGPGKPFWSWPSVPSGKSHRCRFLGGAVGDRRP
jgi:hypothetical protein